MGRQRDMSQMKEQNKTPEKELNKMETNNLPDAEFRTLVIRMLREFRGRVDELSKNFNIEIGNIIWTLKKLKTTKNEEHNN